MLDDPIYAVAFAKGLAMMDEAVAYATEGADP